VKLRLGKLSLPLETVTQSIAILARKRAGKSYLARGIAEQLLSAEQQVVIVDPKGDWWGIRSSADGKGPGFPVVVLGGEHGDLPLEKGAAETVAHLIVEERVSVLLDLSEFRKYEVAKFLGGDVRDRADGLLEIMYRLKAKEEFRSPVMLIVDEADAIAPQKPNPGEERMLGAMSDIVRRGGQRGIGCTLITQRSAVINKDVLTQTQVMVALRTIAPLDLAALMGWVDVHGLPEQAATLKASLPALPTGDVWVLSPGWPTDAGIFNRIHANAITTFDSGATPKPGEKRVRPKTVADVDLAALQRRMAETIERKKQDDPAELRRQIAELRKQLASQAKAVPSPAPDPAALKKAREQGAADVKRALGVDLAKYRQSIEKRLAIIKGSMESAARGLEGLPAFPVLDELIASASTAAPAPAPPVTRDPRRVPRPPPRPRPNATPAEGADDRLAPFERKMLTALAQYPAGLAKERLAIMVGAHLNGTFYNNLGALRSRGLASDKSVNPIQITDAGLGALGPFDPLPTGAELRLYWIQRLSRSEGRMLEYLCGVYPESLSKEDLAAQCGMQLNGTFYNALGALRGRGLATPAKTPIAAAKELFE
jgi:hypothetical protein